MSCSPHSGVYGEAPLVRYDPSSRTGQLRLSECRGDHTDLCNQSRPAACRLYQLLAGACFKPTSFRIDVRMAATCRPPLPGGSKGRRCRRIALVVICGGILAQPAARFFMLVPSLPPTPPAP